MRQRLGVVRDTLPLERRGDEQQRNPLPTTWAESTSRGVPSPPLDRLLGQMCSIPFLDQAIYPSEIMPHSPLTIEHSPEHVPLWTDWSPFIKKGILGAVAAAHQATVQIYRLGHESVHPLFRHHVRHARTESDASLLRMQLHVLQGRAARAKLGFYTSEERFSILQIQMARGWSHARTAREFQVCARTIAKWHREFGADITSIPTNASTFFSWGPKTFPRIFPETRSVVAVIDSFSRKVLAIRCFGAGATAAQVIATLDEAIAFAGAPPIHLITDKGSQFYSKKKSPATKLRAWLKKHSVKIRFGAVGKKGSIAIIERHFLTLKNEGTRTMLIPLGREEVDTELSVFAEWYNTKRPHSSLGGCTPEEQRLDGELLSQRPRYETRPNYPVDPEDLAAGRVWRIKSATLDPKCFKRQKHLPDISLDVAA